MSISDMTALELGRRIQSGDITAVQAAEASLARIKAMEPSVHAFVTVNEEKTMEQAGKVQADIEAGRLKGPWPEYRWPSRTTCVQRECGPPAVPGYWEFHSHLHGQAVSNLEQAGAVILGKTNMDEFAMGSTTETSAFGVTRNPWNLEHVPGDPPAVPARRWLPGSAFMPWGSDTGGSIRQPSSFCGVTGIKPTYGTVSRYGLIAYGSSLDQIGPVAKDVSGLRRCFGGPGLP